jgi:hypothetical protein
MMYNKTLQFVVYYGGNCKLFIQKILKALTFKMLPPPQTVLIKLLEVDRWGSYVCSMSVINIMDFSKFLEYKY